jgi:hypothetical protein
VVADGCEINSRSVGGLPRNHRSLSSFCSLREIVLRNIGKNNDWWDWGVILLLIAAGTIILWAGLWVAHSRAGAPRDAATARIASSVLPIDVCHAQEEADA